MKLTDGEGTTLSIDVGRGEHECIIDIVEGEDVAGFYLRPDDALALAAVLQEWARDRMSQDGLF